MYSVWASIVMIVSRAHGMGKYCTKGLENPTIHAKTIVE